MNKFIVSLLILSLAVVIIIKMSFITAQGCPLIPREVLFGNNEKKVQVKISPKGNYLTYLAPVNTVMNVWMRSIDGKDDRPITHDKDRGIQGYWWSYNEDRIFYIQDTAGNENWRLYSVTISDGKITEYTPFEGVQVRLIEYNKEHPDHMLIEMNKRDPKAHDAYDLNIQTGELKLLIENPGKVVGWIANNELAIIGNYEAMADGGFQISVRDAEDKPWRVLGVWSKNEEAPGDAYISKDGNYLYTTDSRNNNTSRFVKINIASGDVTILASDPEYDISGQLIIDSDTLEPLAISYKKERSNWLFFRADIEDTFSLLQAIDHGDISVTSRTHDNKMWVVAFMKDDGPVSYWLFDRRTGNKTFLFDHQPIFKKYELMPMEPIEFKARDGLLIHGYLTYPCGSEKTNLPLVLDVHGGPWSRDAWGFNTEVQWLANRGYAVLQVNYRGSTGYGKAFVNSSFKQWGRAMQDDLTDAVHWAIDKGIADPKRVAIYGGSYGGYAALAGATFTPELYCCAVDIVGPSNISTFLQAIPDFWATLIEVNNNRIGNPKTEKDFLDSISPLFHVDAIKIPMLIAQGANDPRVKQAESEQIVEAMKKKGIDYEYLLFSDEGHGFVKPQNRLKFYRTAEKFLAKHLGGRYEY